MRLQGTVALVTGGGRGIGRHAAIALARAGSSVCVTARSQEQLDDTVQRVRRAGGPDALALAGDVRSVRDVAHVVDRTHEQLGPVDVLVNCAGAAPTDPGPIGTTDPDDWWRVMEVNVRGPMLFASRVVPGMVDRGHGRILNINSLAGIDARTAGAASAYGVSKAALFRFTDILAAELAGTGVVALDVSPGLVRTAMTTGVPAFADIPEEQWTEVEVAAELVVEVAAGRMDAMAGRLVHVADDLDRLLQDVGRITERSARTLTLRPYGADDPLIP